VKSTVFHQLFQRETIYHSGILRLKALALHRILVYLCPSYYALDLAPERILASE